jgi:subtilisin
MIRNFLSQVLVSLMMVLFFISLTQAQPDNIVPNRFICQVDDFEFPSMIGAAAVEATGGTLGHVYQYALNGFSIQVPPGIIVANLVAVPGIVAAEPDLVMEMFGQTLPTGIDRIDADQNATAHIDKVDERVDVDIAIIDTGIDGDHPDLDVRRGKRFYTTNTGPLWARGSFVDDNYDDDNGHGSHCAGIAAAIDNEIGVVGVAPGARLWAVKVLDSDGSGYLSDIIAGVDWVTENADTIEVASMSLGGTGSSGAFRTAIQNSVNAGVVYVVAAGNDSRDIYGVDGVFDTDDDIIPAAYPEVATISAMADFDGQPGGADGSTDDSFASFSNFSWSVVADNPVSSPGAGIDLLLPGVDIYSCYKDGGYAWASGTSMATPHAAGLVALHIAVSSRAYNATEVYTIRQALIDGGVAQESGYGLATLNDPDMNWDNIGWAGSLEPIKDLDIAVTAVTTTSSILQGSVVDVVVTIRNLGSQDVTSDIYVTLTDDTDNETIGAQTISGGLVAGDSATLSFAWDTNGALPGEHTLTASHDFIDEGSTNNFKSNTVTVTEASSGGMYVWGIGFKETGLHLKAIVTIQVDSDGDGEAESMDDPVSGATVYCSLTHDSRTKTYQGTTDSIGQVEFQWKKAPSGTYTAEVTHLTHVTYTWNSSLDVDNPSSYTKQ